jgi:hypothetical protein
MGKTEVFVVADRGQGIGFWDYAQNDVLGMSVTPSLPITLGLPVILGAVPGSIMRRILITALILLTLTFAIIPANIAVFADDIPAVPEVVDAIYLKNDEAGTDGKKHFVGEDFDSKYKTPGITVKGKTIQLNGYYTTNISDGVRYETADTASPLGPVLLQWFSSDDNIATVSPDGLITPVHDGEVIITATISDAISEENKYEENAPAKSVTIKVSGQTAEYVKSVTIIDADGEVLSSKSDADTPISGKNIFFSFYALVVWHNPGTGTDRTEDTRTDSITSTIKWTVGGSSVVGTINEDTGRFKSSEYSGNCFVQCSVTGGVDGKAVTDIARVQVDTGEYSYPPANSLTLKVVYQKFPDEVVQEHKYSLTELSDQLASYTHSYTVLGGTRYGTIRATGYLFKDILALEGVDIGDVYQYRFTTSDGYDNPITSKLLFDSGSRYYYPNWDISSRAGAQVVPPLLAYSSNLIWGVSEVDSTAPLDDATRFRLVFGPLASAESNSSFQIYYIRAITIVLTGAPPAEIDKGKNDEPESGDKGDGKDADKEDSSSNGNSKDNEAELENASSDSDKNIVNKTENFPGDGGSGSGANNASGNVSGNSENGTTGGNEVSKVGFGNSNVFADVAKGLVKTPSTSSGHKWKIYEMISNSKSNVASLDMDLPYLPLAIPLAGAGFLAGGLTFYIGYRRRLS